MMRQPIARFSESEPSGHMHCSADSIIITSGFRFSAHKGGDGGRAVVRRIEPSPAFIKQFGRPAETVITLDHVLGPVLPIGRKMTSPRSISIVDLDGTKHECVAEAFDTKWNVLILLYPITALTATTIILPPGFKKQIQTAGA